MVAITLFIGPWQGGLRARQIEVADRCRLGDRQPDRQRLVDHAVAVDQGLARVGAVRDLGDLGAHLLLGAGAQLGDRRRDRVVAIAVEQRGQPPLADRQGRRLGLDVADPLVGDADVGAG